ncbi:MAG: GH116 family glycosyl hydrolase [Candidatus Sulfotelmatobacter sp.]
MWVGTSFGFAALLLSEGMRDEAYRMAWGLYHVIYESKGLVPYSEAWDVEGNFRAWMYMRPVAIWAMEMIPQPRVETLPSARPAARKKEPADK